MPLSTIYVCPTDRSLQCSWEGACEDILDHFILEHEDKLLHSSEVDIYLNVKSDNLLLFVDEEIYLIQLKIENKFLKIGLRYLGSNKSAKKTTYDIILVVDGQKYFYNYFNNGPSVFEIVDGFWLINLHLLELLHENLNVVQCNFSISTKTETLEEEIVESEDNVENTEQPEILDTVSDDSDQGTLIRDDEIDDILNEEVELRNVKKNNERDALDNMSALNFSILEKDDRQIRRYSSFIGIPEELFHEDEIVCDLSCSNCSIKMLPPIYLCVNNHNICADCKYEPCKICSGAPTEFRNKELEEYSRKCLHLCRYHLDGCSESFMYNEIRNHEMKCNFCSYRCMQDCTFKGKFNEFYSHFKIKHPSCKIIYKTPVDFPRNSDFFVSDNRLGIFHCTSSFSNNTIRWIVVFLGPSDRSFFCELKFKGVKNKDPDGLFLKRLEDQYSLAYTKEELKKMKVKEKNAVLTITSYFQLYTEPL